MFSLLRNRQTKPGELAASQLYDQDAFYKAFLRDLGNCKNELVIECPFVTIKRMSVLLPALRRLARQGVRIIINTRDPEEHDEYFRRQALTVVAGLHAIDVLVLYTKRHHRKLAIIDRRITWEGSLNIMSHNTSIEVMRRINSTALARQMICFLGLDKYLR